MLSMPEDTALTPSQIEDLRFAAKKMTGLLGEPFKRGFVKSIVKGMPEKLKKSWVGDEDQSNWG
jgi:hypothetical protein